MSIKITTDIEPADVRDEYALMNAKYLKGGFLVANTKAELANDSAERRENRLYFVKDENKFYQWSDTSSDHVEVPITSSGGAMTGAEIIQAIQNDPSDPKLVADDISKLTQTDYKELTGATLLDAIDKTYIELIFKGSSDVRQTLSSQANTRDGMRLMVRNKTTNDNVVTLLPGSSGQTIDGQANFDVDPGVSVLFIFMKKTNTWRKEAEFEHASGNPLTSGITLDNGTENIAGVTKINVPTSELLSKGGGEVDLTPYLTLRNEPSNQQDNLSHQLVVQPPLKTFSDPDVQGGGKLYIDPMAYESMHKPSYLAYLSENEDVVGKITQGYENTAGSHHNGAIWFDDIITPAGAFIKADRDNKKYGIQEADTLDPNVSGGTDYLIAARIHMKGTAPDDGFVRLYLYNKSINPFAPKGYLLDTNSHPLAVERHYKTGQELGVLDVMGVVNAKGLQEFTVHVVDNFSNDVLELTDRTEGASGLLIQALSSEEKTGLGLLQFENDTNQNIEFSSHYLGEDRMDLGWINSRPESVVSYTANTNFTTVMGWRLINPNGIKVGVVNGHTHIQDDGVHACDFNYGKVFSAEETQMLRGKTIHVTTTLVDKNAGFRVGLMKWTGSPDEYTHEIFTTRDGGGSPEFQTNWAQADNLFISEDVVSGDHTLTKVMTVPSDANNYAIVIYPVEAQRPLTLKLKDLKVDVNPSFIGYALQAPELANEMHLLEDDELKSFKQDTQGYASLRYTINDTAGGLPMPVGIPDKGKAPISLDSTVNQVVGSQAKGGEGALKFEEEGRASIVTTLRLWNEKSTDNTATFWWSTVGPDGNMVKIDDSEFTFTVPANSRETLHRFKYEGDFESGNRISLRAKSNVADGAFLECVSNARPMVEVDVEFKVLVADSGDTPGTGIDLSSFSKVPQVRDVGIYNFFNKNRVEIPLVIPADVTMAVQAVHRLDGANVRPVDYDFMYDNSSDTMIFTFPNHYTGQIILEFFA